MRIGDEEYKALYAQYLKEHRPASFDSLAASMTWGVKARAAFKEMLKNKGVVLEPPLEPKPPERKSFAEWMKDHEG